MKYLLLEITVALILLAAAVALTYYFAGQEGFPWGIAAGAFALLAFELLAAMLGDLKWRDLR